MPKPTDDALALDKIIIDTINYQFSDVISQNKITVTDKTLLSDLDLTPVSNQDLFVPIRDAVNAGGFNYNGPKRSAYQKFKTVGEIEKAVISGIATAHSESASALMSVIHDRISAGK